MLGAARTGTGETGRQAMEWVSVVEYDSPAVVRVIWRPTGAGPGPEVPCVVTQYATVPDGSRFRVQSETTFVVGEWERTEPGSTSGEAYTSRRMAQAWARRMAEAEAGNRGAISWNGEVPA
jgi:hypothetical protein